MTIEFRIFIAAPSEVEEQRKAVFDVVATIARWVESPTTPLPHWVPQVLGDVTQEKTRRSAVAKAVGTLICASGGSRSHGEPPAGPGRGPASRRELTKFSRDREKGWNTPWQVLVEGRKDIPTSTRSHWPGRASHSPRRPSLSTGVRNVSWADPTQSRTAVAGFTHRVLE